MQGIAINGAVAALVPQRGEDREEIDTRIEKPPRTDFERNHGLEAGVAAVDHVAGEEDGGDIPVDCEVDAAF